MFCANCRHELSDTDRFCPRCGNAAGHNRGAGRAGADTSLRGVFTGVAHRINKAAGVETPSELKWSEIFSNVFQKHSEDEAERLFFVGTRQTTPDIADVTDTWPKPWLFARVFVLVALAYLGLFLGLDFFHNLNFLPGLIMLGSFMVPFTLLVFFWEMNAPQNISFYKIVKVLLVGGVLSLIAAVFLFEHLGSRSPVIVGIVEEAAKVLVVLWFLRDGKYPYILNGLLIGAAVGTGFAAFESAGYALRVALASGDLGEMYSTLFWRGLLSPGGHIGWAALSGAAVCMVKGNRPFAWPMLQDIRFLRIFGIVVVLHAVWDLDWPIPADVPVFQIGLTVVSWIIAFAVMDAGLKEVSRLKEKSLQEREALTAEKRTGTTSSEGRSQEGATTWM